MIGERRVTGDAFGPGSHHRRRSIHGRRILGGDLEKMSKLLFGHCRSPLICGVRPCRMPTPWREIYEVSGIG
jgi:hypothetical protein